MKYKEMLKVLEDCRDKKVLVKLRDKIGEKLESLGYGIGDTVTITIYYMIGDADGNTTEAMDFDIATEQDLAALTVIRDILDNHTQPNPGHWGFILEYGSFDQKPDQVWQTLYPVYDYDTGTYEINCPVYVTAEGTPITIDQSVMESIQTIVEEVFRSGFENSFLVFESYEITI